MAGKRKRLMYSKGDKVASAKLYVVEPQTAVREHISDKQSQRTVLTDQRVDAYLYRYDKHKCRKSYRNV